MITEEQRLIILKALRDSYANLTAKEMTEKEFDNLTNAMTIVRNCSIPDVVRQSEQLADFKCPPYDRCKNICDECAVANGLKQG